MDRKELSKIADRLIIKRTQGHFLEQTLENLKLLCE
jgi:hypothetical protein